MSTAQRPTRIPTATAAAGQNPSVPEMTAQGSTRRPYRTSPPSTTRERSTHQPIAVHLGRNGHRTVNSPGHDADTNESTVRRSTHPPAAPSERTTEQPTQPSRTSPSSRQPIRTATRPRVDHSAVNSFRPTQHRRTRRPSGSELDPPWQAQSRRVDLINGQLAPTLQPFSLCSRRRPLTDQQPTRLPPRRTGGRAAPPTANPRRRSRHSAR